MRNIVTIHVDVDPMGKPRMTQKDKWARRPVVLRYWSFCDMIRLAARNVDGVNVQKEIEDAVIDHFLVEAIMPMPENWSEKKKQEMEGQPHRVKPDLDNAHKGVQDALLKDDSGVASIEATKSWGRKGYLGITIHYTKN